MESRKTIHRQESRRIDIWMLVNISFYFVALLSIGSNAALVMYLTNAAA